MIGRIVSHYLDELGSGAMGVLYRAEDTKLRRVVAVKFLPPDLTRNVEAKEYFVREARAARGLESRAWLLSWTTSRSNPLLERRR